MGNNAVGTRSILGKYEQLRVGQLEQQLFHSHVPLWKARRQNGKTISGTERDDYSSGSLHPNGLTELLIYMRDIRVELKPGPEFESNPW